MSDQANTTAPIGDAAPSVKAQRLASFVGRTTQHDSETVEFWRAASPAAHAAAMIELSEYAAQMVARTGFGKDPEEMFPGFTSAQGRRFPGGRA